MNAGQARLQKPLLRASLVSYGPLAHDSCKREQRGAGPRAAPPTKRIQVLVEDLTHHRPLPISTVDKQPRVHDHYRLIMAQESIPLVRTASGENTDKAGLVKAVEASAFRSARRASASATRNTTKSSRFSWGLVSRA